jgi:hypothetical protein
VITHITEKLGHTGRARTEFTGRSCRVVCFNSYCWREQIDSYEVGSSKHTNMAIT